MPFWPPRAPDIHAGRNILEYTLDGLGGVGSASLVCGWQNVLKALVKMALTIMPKNELQHLSNTKNWLMGHSCKGYILPVCLRFYRSPLPFTSVMILKKKDNIDTPLPNYVFCLAYRNIVIQVPIPMVDLDIQFKGKEFEFPLIPTPLDEYSEPFISTPINLSGKDKIRGEVVSIGLRYKSAFQSFPDKESKVIDSKD